MTRRLVAKKPTAATSDGPPPIKLSPKQLELVQLLRRGWRIMRGQTASSQSVNGSATFSWGEMVCAPGRTQGTKLNARIADALSTKGLLENIPRDTPTPSFEELGELLRYNNTPRETMRLTALGKTVAL